MGRPEEKVGTVVDMTLCRVGYIRHTHTPTLSSIEASKGIIRVQGDIPVMLEHWRVLGRGAGGCGLGRGGVVWGGLENPEVHVERHEVGDAHM